MTTDEVIAANEKLFRERAIDAQRQGQRWHMLATDPFLCDDDRAWYQACAESAYERARRCYSDYRRTILA